MITEEEKGKNDKVEKAGKEETIKEAEKETIQEMIIRRGK